MNDRKTNLNYIFKPVGVLAKDPLQRTPAYGATLRGFATFQYIPRLFQLATPPSNRSIPRNGPLKYKVRRRKSRIFCLRPDTLGLNWTLPPLPCFHFAAGGASARP